MKTAVLLLLGISLNLTFIIFFQMLSRNVPLDKAMLGSVLMFGSALWDIYAYSRKHTIVGKEQETIKYEQEQ
jgi:hypothetical protein